MTWRVATLASFACWGLALNLALVAVGPFGYYSDLASTPWYLVGWLLFMLGCEALTRAARARYPSAAFVLRCSWPFAVGPEALLTLPLTASSLGISLVGLQAYFYLDQFVFFLQLPGIGLSRLLGNSFYGRWWTGLVDPPTLSILLELVFLNLANLASWCLLVVAGRALHRMVVARKAGGSNESGA